MKFECDSCGANYMIADEKVGKRGVKVKCKRCANVIIVRPEAKAAEVEAESPATMDEDESVFGDSASGDAPPAMTSSANDEATAVGHPPGLSASNGDDVDLGSMAASEEDDDECAFASSNDGGGFGAGSLLSDAEDSASEDGASDDGDSASDNGGNDDDDAWSASSDHGDGDAAADEASEQQVAANDELAGFDDDDDDETVAGGAGSPLGATLADEAHAASDPEDDAGRGEAAALDELAALAASTAADDDEVPPPPVLDEPPASGGDDAKTSVGAVPGWQMSGENDTLMGANPDVTDANLQMPSAEDLAGSSGLDGEDDALDALAGLSGADDVPPPPEFDAGDDAAADSSMSSVGDGGMGLADDASAANRPLQGEESDAFDAQLAGAFSNMFGDAPAAGDDVPPPPALDDMEGFRGPTQVLDINQMDALRAEATPSAEGHASNLDAAYGSFNTFGGMDTAMGDPVEDTATQMADFDDDEGGWHVAIDDEDVGPLSLGAIAEHVHGGRVDRDSLVWRTGMDDWEPAGDVPQMARLFDSLPMPKIDPSFDVGAPIDDMGGGGDPFSNVPDVSADPNWQPHGLTDVYQAANLAEAAGLGLPTAGASNAKPDDDEDEGEWRPGAAGALAALVESEINRIDNPEPDEVSSPGGLAPADDMASGMFADGAGAGAEVGGLSSAPSSAGFPLGGGLGGAGGMSSPALSTPPIAMGGLSSPALSTPGMMAAQVPSVDTYPPHAAMSGFTPVQPPAPQRSNTLLILGGIGVVGVLLLVVVLAVAALIVSMNNNNAPVVAANPPPGNTDSSGQGGGGSGEGDKVAVASDPGAKDEAAPAATPGEQAAEGEVKEASGAQPAGAKADEPAKSDDAKAEDAKADAPAPKDEPKKEETKKEEIKKEEIKKEETKKEETKVASAKKADPRKARRSSGRRSSSRASSPPPPKRSKPVPKPRRKETRKATKRSGDCDPILDIDCEEKKSKSKKRSNVKESLSKSDILVVVKKNIGSIMKCFKANNVKDQVKMEWKISNSGRTKGVRVLTSKYAGTPMGRCMTNAVKRFKFPAFSGDPPPPIKFPFKP